MSYLYSLPVAFDWIHDIDHSFHGRIFDQVRYLTMNDIHPFECKSFQSISQQFPFLKYLQISNDKSQEHKQMLIYIVCWTSASNTDHYERCWTIQFMYIDKSRCMRILCSSKEFSSILSFVVISLNKQNILKNKVMLLKNTFEIFFYE